MKEFWKDVLETGIAFYKFLGVVLAVMFPVIIGVAFIAWFVSG